MRNRWRLFLASNNPQTRTIGTIMDHNIIRNRLLAVVKEGEVVVHSTTIPHWELVLERSIQTPHQ